MRRVRIIHVRIQERTGGADDTLLILEGKPIRLAEGIFQAGAGVEAEAVGRLAIDIKVAELALERYFTREVAPLFVQGEVEEIQVAVHVIRIGFLRVRDPCARFEVRRVRPVFFQLGTAYIARLQGITRGERVHIAGRPVEIPLFLTDEEVIFGGNLAGCRVLVLVVVILVVNEVIVVENHI